MSVIIDTGATGATGAIPAGGIIPFAGFFPPDGWLLCDGTSYSAQVYPELFSVLGYTYGGPGDGNFSVPDLRGRMPIGPDSDSTAENTATRSIGTEGGDTRMPAHVHDISRSNVAASSTGTDTSTVYQTLSGTGSIYTTTQDAGSGGAGNMPPFLVTNYIIKAVTVAPPSGGLAYGSTPPLVTALPVNPKLGDVVTYIADAANGVAWNLQYDASGTYPWKFIGGAPMEAHVAGSQGTASISPVAIGGPTMTVPLTGKYVFGIEGFVLAASGGPVITYQRLSVGGTGKFDLWRETGVNGFMTLAACQFSDTGAVTAGQTASHLSASPQGATVGFYERRIRMTPIAVAA